MHPETTVALQLPRAMRHGSVHAVQGHGTRRVRHIHTGFTGPGSGKHYVASQDRFSGRETGLLADPPDLVGSLATDET
ncbi:MAG: hypothetical protein QGF87_04650 [Woeseiaceae bacterium]|nr:hypothetical protein [Woeseiaceae bacterium]